MENSGRRHTTRDLLLQVWKTQVDATQQDDSTDENDPEYNERLCRTSMHVVTTIELGFQLCKFSCTYNNKNNKKYCMRPSDFIECCALQVATC